jgi:uncharacterized protein YecT (DUF1311 family)
MRRLAVLSGIALILVGAWAASAGSGITPLPVLYNRSCERSALTQIALDVCAGRELAQLQRELQNALAAQAKLYGWSLVGAAQAAWASYRDAECRLEASQNAGGSIYPLTYGDCEIALTVTRIVFVRQAAGILPAQDFVSHPRLTSVGYRGLLPTARFAMPQASEGNIFLAVSPRRAADGGFLQKNIAYEEDLTTAEINAGRWVYTNNSAPFPMPVDPGVYYVMVQGLPAACFRGDGEPLARCKGYSNVVKFTMPGPPIRYAFAAISQCTGCKVLITELDAASATPLHNVPYEVCATTKTRMQECLDGTLNGFDWSGPPDDIDLDTTGLASTTTITWRVGARVVGRERVRIPSTG